MRDWIVGLEKAATTRKPGVGDFDWGEVSTELDRDVPEELRDLYKSMNGATFNNGVKLHPLRGMGVSPSVVEQSRDSQGYWRFGEKPDGTPLFAVQKSVLGQAVPDARPADWVSGLSEAAWVFGAQKEGAYKWYRSLEQLLGALVPPVQMEEFGDVTYARAMSAVNSALSELGSSARAVLQLPSPKARSAKAKKPVRKLLAKVTKAVRKAITQKPAKKKAKVKAKAPRRAPAKKAAPKAKAAVRKPSKSAGRAASKKRR